MKVWNTSKQIIYWLWKHVPTHEDGGIDEISLTGLSGDPADTINESLLTTQDDIIVRGASIAERLNITEQTLAGRLTGGNVSAVAIGIADNNILQVDHASPADNDYAKFTAAGIEGRAYDEVLSDLSGQAGAAFSMNSNRIITLGTPTASTDATTKEYVDAAIASMVWEYFLNDTASGIDSYYTMSQTATGDVESTFTTASLGGGDAQALTEWITDATIPFLVIRAGKLDFHIHAERTAGNRSVVIYAELYEYKTDTSEVLIATTEDSSAITDKAGVGIHATLANDYTFTTGSKILVKYLADLGAGAPTTIVLYAEGANVSNVNVSVLSSAFDDVYIRHSLFGAHTILAATSDDTPAAITMGASTILARLAAGNIVAATGAETLALLTGANLDVGAYDVRGQTITADGITAGQVVFTGVNGVLSGDTDFTFATDTLTVTKIGAFEATGAINFASQNMTNVDIDSGTIGGVTLDGTLTLGGQAFDAGSGDAILTTTGSLKGLDIRGSNSFHGPQLRLWHNHTTPDVNIIIGLITYLGYDGNASPATFEYGSTRVIASNVTDTTEEGTFEVRLATAGAEDNLAMTLSGAGALWVDGSITLDANETVDGVDISAHAANTTTVHGAVSAATASKHVVRDASARAKFAAPGASGDALIKGTRVTTSELPTLSENKIWAGNGSNEPVEADPIPAASDWKGNFSWDTSENTTDEVDISALFSTHLAYATRRKYTIKLDLTTVEADGSFVSCYISVKEKIDGTNYRAIDRKLVKKADIAANAEPGIPIIVPATSENIQITMQMTTATAGDCTIYYAVVKEHLE